MSANTHAPAYPWGEHGHRYGGLTKRELFAAMAMQATLSNPGYCSEDIDAYEGGVASWSVGCADALLAELDAEAAK